MTVELWVGQDFDTTHERIALAKFLKDMVEHFGDSKEYFFILANFYLDGKAIDLAVIKQDAVIVIEVKKCSDPFTATENGDWITSSGYKIQTDGQNPFAQVRKYRLLMADYLKRNQEKFLASTKIDTVKFVHSSALVCVDPKIHPGTENQITSATVDSWFKLTGLDELWQTVYQRTNTSIDLSEEEIRKIIKLLNLKQGDLLIGKPIEQKEIQIDLPDPPEYFVGRNEHLDYLNKLLLQDDGKTVVVQGEPGAGKTTLALAFAYSAKDNFRDGIYWISAYGKTDTRVVVRELAEKVNGGLIRISEYAQAWEIWNKYISTKDVLGIIDNADDLNIDFRFMSKKCKIIFTTRSILTQQYLGLPEEDVIKIPSLKIDESIALMQQILGKDFSGTELEKARELANSLGNLPIGIDRASRYMKVYQTPVQTYLEKKGLSKLDLKPGETKKRFGQNLDVFPPNIINFFASLGVCRSSSFNLELAQAIGDKIVVDVEDALNKLRGIAMIDKLSNGRYSFHPLIKEYAWELAHENGLVEQTEARYYGWHEELINNFPIHEDELESKYPNDQNAQSEAKPENTIRLGRELDGLFATAEWKLGLNDVDLTAFRIFWRNLREALETRGITDRAVELLETALAVARKNVELDTEMPFSTFQSDNKLMEGYYLAQLGKFYDRAGRLDDAVRTLEEAVRLEKDKKRKKNAVMRLGVAQGRKKNFEKAIGYLRDNLRSSENEGEASILYALNALARALIDSGEPQEALIHLNRALKIEESRLVDTKSRSITLSEIGRAYKRLNDYPVALSYYKKAIEVIEEHINPRSFGILCNEIGEIMGLMGLYKDSFDYFFKSSQIAKTFQDPRSKNITKSRFLRTLKSLIQEIKVYKKNKNWQDMLPLVRNWLNAEKTMGSIAHEYWALIDYGYVLYNIDDNATALSVYSEALDIAIKINNLRTQYIARQRKIRVLEKIDTVESLHEALIEIDKNEFLAQQIPDQDIKELLLSKFWILIGYGNKLARSSNRNSLPNAIKAYEAALNNAKNREDRRGQSVAYQSLGRIFAKQNNPSAIQHFTYAESIELSTTNNSDQLNRILIEKAKSFLSFGEVEKAAHCVESVLARNPEDKYAKALFSKCPVKKDVIDKLKVGKRGIIKAIIQKTDQGLRYGVVELKEPAGNHVYFSPSALEEKWNDLHLNQVAFVDYADEGKDKIIATRVVLQY